MRTCRCAQECERRLRLISSAIVSEEGRISSRTIEREFDNWCGCSGSEAPTTAEDAKARALLGAKAGGMTYAEVDFAFRAMKREGRPEYDTLTFRYAVVARVSAFDTLNALTTDAEQMFCFIASLDVDGDGLVSIQDLQKKVLEYARKEEAAQAERSPLNAHQGSSRKASMKKAATAKWDAASAVAILASKHSSSQAQSEEASPQPAEAASPQLAEQA